MKVVSKQCTVDGCAVGQYCRSFCVMHYQRFRRFGDPGTADRLRGEYGRGSVNGDGYRTVHLRDHPLARAQGKVLEHRVVLFDRIGEGPQSCHWCKKALTWEGSAESRVCVDHLDFDRLNNTSNNLVPSCLDCNAKRTPA